MKLITIVLLVISLMEIGCEGNRQIIAQGDWESAVVVVTQTPNPDGDGDGIDDAYDCDPDNPEVSQIAVEICNGIDDDCDDLVDDEDPSVTGQQSFFADADEDGYGIPVSSCEEPFAVAIYEELDCNDKAPAVNPEGHEVCSDGVDQDCDGQDLSCADADNDGDGFTEND